MNLKEKWLKTLSIMNQTHIYFDTETAKPDFERDIEQIIKESMIRALQQAGKEYRISDLTNPTTEIVDETLATIQDHHELNSKKSRLIARHSEMIDRYHKYKDTRKAESWSDFKEKFRFLCFRLITTIGIAAIILTTSWVSDVLEIPLPLRVSSGSSSVKPPKVEAIKNNIPTPKIEIVTNKSK